MSRTYKKIVDSITCDICGLSSDDEHDFRVYIFRAKCVDETVDLCFDCQRTVYSGIISEKSRWTRKKE